MSEEGARAWSFLSSCDHIELRPGGREEVISVAEDFPYLAVYSGYDRYQGRSVPWHWHQEIELFYVLSGTVEYETPHEHLTLGAGAAGFVNANVLHMTRCAPRSTWSRRCGRAGRCACA